MLVRAAVFGEVGGEGDLRVAFADARNVLVHGQAQPSCFVRPLGDASNSGCCAGTVVWTR